MSSEASSTADVSDGEDFTPSAEELESFYVMLENGIIPELSWKCPGRRNPEAVAKVEQCMAADSTETQEPVKNDFDFSDEVSEVKVRVRQNTTPKSTKKKMANFAGVMEVLQKKKNAEGAGAP